MAIFFACCYVTRWGKFGQVFCKQTSVAGCRFQNECNKVEIALRVVQFWSEIKLVITNRTSASRSCDFVITRLISDQIALHSVQLPLFIEASNPPSFAMEFFKICHSKTFRARNFALRTFCCFFLHYINVRSLFFEDISVEYEFKSQGCIIDLKLNNLDMETQRNSKHYRRAHAHIVFTN